MTSLYPEVAWVNDVLPAWSWKRSSNPRHPQVRRGIHKDTLPHDLLDVLELNRI